MSEAGKRDEDRIRAWIERELGGHVTRMERQPRWRPAWLVDLERPNGDQLPIYFRGDRGLGSGGAYALEHEYRVLQVLEAQGIPVPHVHGFCDAPRGIVMERSPGRSDLGTAESEQERQSVQDDYMRILARLHELDLAPFLEIGLAPPPSAERFALSDLEIWERGYRGAKSRPEPLIEFGLGWLKRNVPEPSGRTSFVCADSGQFVFENGRVTALLDLELSHLGDPAEDLGGLRGRDMSEPLGDLKRAVETYEKVAGWKVDRRLIDYHAVRFTLVTPLATAALVANPIPGHDLVQYLCWYHVFGRAPLEAIAHMQGIPLEAPELPDSSPTRHSAAHDLLVGSLEPDQGAYEGEPAYRLAEYLRRADRYGPALEADDCAEVAQLTGSQPASWQEADRLLEEAILAAGSERDADFVRHLYRRTLRQEALLAPVMAELSDVRMQMLD
jgi:aminoglycoside phosphotransferase (APT) family kinase protein